MAKTDSVLLVALGGLLVLLLLCACCVGGAAYLPFKWLGAAGGPAGAAKDFIRKDALVAEHLGHDLKFGTVPSGSISEENGQGRAHLRYSVEGSSGKGDVELELVRPKGGSWEVKAALLTVGSEKIPLKGEITPPSPPEPPPFLFPPEPPPVPPPSPSQSSPQDSGEAVEA